MFSAPVPEPAARFFHNSNDLAGGLRLLAQAPEYVYLLEMSLDKLQCMIDARVIRAKQRVRRWCPGLDQRGARSRPLALLAKSPVADLDFGSTMAKALKSLLSPQDQS